MKNLVKTTMLTVVSLMAVSFFTGCDKEMVNEPSQVQTKIAENSMEDKNLLTASKPIDQYSEEEIVKEVFPILQKFIDAQFTYAMGKDKVPQWDQYLKTPDLKLKENMDLAISKKRMPTILSATGSLNPSNNGYTKIFFKEGKWHINKAVEYFKIPLDATGDVSGIYPIVSEGGWNYSFVVSQNKKGEWQIESWRDDENLMESPFWNPSPPKLQSQPKRGESIHPIPLNLQSRGYNAQLAVDYANAHWNNPNSAWCDYTNNGGDCTNFVSQCLLSGGWTQKYGSGYCSNDAWFHKGSDHCWNTSTVKNYSCSWTQAKDLYRYLNNVSNANVTWLGNSCIAPRIGDILQFKKNGQIVHSAIIVETNGSDAYIAYRNANGYNPVGHLRIDMLQQYDFLYYWSINGGNGILS